MILKSRIKINFDHNPPDPGSTTTSTTNLDEGELSVPVRDPVFTQHFFRLKPPGRAVELEEARRVQVTVDRAVERVVVFAVAAQRAEEGGRLFRFFDLDRVRIVRFLKNLKIKTKLKLETTKNLQLQV